MLAVGTALVYLLAGSRCAPFLRRGLRDDRGGGPESTRTRRASTRAWFASGDGSRASSAAIVIVFIGVRELGADVVPLLAGLGVGGLAVALAVRPTLENMIGGVILYADRPIAVGDYCTFGDQSGVVEGIGLRSTRIRGLDRTLISIPNAAVRGHAARQTGPTATRC